MKTFPQYEQSMTASPTNPTQRQQIQNLRQTFLTTGRGIFDNCPDTPERVSLIGELRMVWLRAVDLIETQEIAHAVGG